MQSSILRLGGYTSQAVGDQNDSGIPYFNVRILFVPGGSVLGNRTGIHKTRQTLRLNRFLTAGLEI